MSKHISAFFVFLQHFADFNIIDYKYIRFAKLRILNSYNIRKRYFSHYRECDKASIMKRLFMGKVLNMIFIYNV